MRVHNVINAIRSAVQKLNDAGCSYEVHENSYDRLYEFLNFINPKYPTDSVDVLDMMNVMVNDYPLPSIQALNLIIDTLDKAEINNHFGELYFRYHHPVLEAVFSYEEQNKTAVISFAQIKTQEFRGNLPLGLPLNITFTIYKDMEDWDNHDKNCSVWEDDNDGICTCEVLGTEVHTLVCKDRNAFKLHAANWLFHRKYSKPMHSVDIDREPEEQL